MRGGFLPRIDATGGKGKEKPDQPSAGINDKDYTRKGYTVSPNQMLFDGLPTYNEVKRAGRARLVRLFRVSRCLREYRAGVFTPISMSCAIATVSICRSRNYIQHRIAFEQLKRRAEPGVGRRVDVESRSWYGWRWPTST
ncbi:MAG: hypothetical protein IPL58_14830 [Betaproteobacteria bacterium]|uniref:Uncharacterized protein n=1 Tax=Candidatus Proximibacter danicus TaxID=2954365 RepID=A0A9D7K487_9PROT|nr:hypothetical protein [Candidatus Proximibacter danicus]